MQGPVAPNLDLGLAQKVFLEYKLALTLKWLENLGIFPNFSTIVFLCVYGGSSSSTGTSYVAQN